MRRPRYAIQGIELSDLACSHAIAVMGEERLNPHSFVHDYYATEYFKITYSHTLRPLIRDDIWEKGPGEVIATPYLKPKGKTICNFKRRPKTEERSKATTYGKVKIV